MCRTQNGPSAAVERRPPTYSTHGAHAIVTRMHGCGGNGAGIGASAGWPPLGLCKFRSAEDEASGTGRQGGATTAVAGEEQCVELVDGCALAEDHLGVQRHRERDRRRREYVPQAEPLLGCDGIDARWVDDEGKRDFHGGLREHRGIRRKRHILDRRKDREPTESLAHVAILDRLQEALRPRELGRMQRHNDGKHRSTRPQPARYGCVASRVEHRVRGRVATRVEQRVRHEAPPTAASSKPFSFRRLFRAGRAEISLSIVRRPEGMCVVEVWN